jgi:hypothetical protein
MPVKYKVISVVTIIGIIKFELFYVLARSNTKLTGSNSTRGMEVCPYFSVVCCPVYAGMLRWADSPSLSTCPR